MKYTFILLLTVSITACNNSNKTEDSLAQDSSFTQPAADKGYIHTFKDTALANAITDELLKLPFVQSSNQYIDSISNHQQGISFLLDEPAEGETDISVQAGYNGNERFETYYRFFVNPKTKAVMVYDPVEDKKLTVKAYLKAQQ